MNTESTELLEKAKRSYSEEEIAHIYQLGRFQLENGNLKAAEPIMRGLTEVAPSNALGWLGVSYIYLFNGDCEQALDAIRGAMKTGQYLVEAMLLQASCLLSLNDIPAAGTVLGELGELIEAGEVSEPHLLRFYRGQLARYQSSR